MVRASISYVPEYPFEGTLHFANGKVGVYKADPDYTLDITGAVNSDEVRVKGVSLLGVDGKVPTALLPQASLSAQGIVRLSDSFGSFDSTVAASSRAVRGLRELLMSTVWTPAQIPELDAARVASGVFDQARIPPLPATSVTGTLAVAQVPDIDAGKITTGKMAVARLPVATTLAAGVVQLSDATDSPDVSVAATSNAVKKVADSVQNILNSPQFGGGGGWGVVDYTNPNPTVMRYCVAKLQGRGQFLQLRGTFTSADADWFASYDIEIRVGELPQGRHMIAEATVVTGSPPTAERGARVRAYFKALTGDVEVVAEVPGNGRFRGTFSAEAATLSLTPAVGSASLPLVTDTVAYHTVFDAYWNATVVREVDPSKAITGMGDSGDIAKGKPATLLSAPLTIEGSVEATGGATIRGALAAKSDVTVDGELVVNDVIEAKKSVKVLETLDVLGNTLVWGRLGCGGLYSPQMQLFVNGATCVNGAVFKWRGDMLTPLTIIDANGNIDWGRITNKPFLSDGAGKTALAAGGLGAIGMLFAGGSLAVASIAKKMSAERGAGTVSVPPRGTPAPEQDVEMRTSPLFEPQADDNSGASRPGAVLRGAMNQASSSQGHSGSHPKVDPPRVHGQRQGRNFKSPGPR